MDLLLDLLQGAGIAAAIGIRPLLPVLIVGALAVANLGVDFGGTEFSFLESWPFIAAIAVLAIGLELVLLRSANTSLWFGLLAVCVVLGGLEGAGSLADRGHPAIAGGIIGVLCAALGAYAARALFTRARRRLDAGAAATLPIYGEVAAGVAAAASVLAPPLALVVIAALASLLVRGRRREERKYAGLRILR
ncbi:MAG: hypothetical protein M3P40_03595 [Actinomycetota bacterium]|nr:hypothetical protein [Actinomycetota bacterium]